MREGFWLGLHPYLSANSFIVFIRFFVCVCKGTKIFCIFAAKFGKYGKEKASIEEIAGGCGEGIATQA
jgi:hypothetical protein